MRVSRVPVCANPATSWPVTPAQLFQPTVSLIGNNSIKRGLVPHNLDIYINIGAFDCDTILILVSQRSQSNRIWVEWVNRMFGYMSNNWIGCISKSFPVLFVAIEDVRGEQNRCIPMDPSAIDHIVKHRYTRPQCVSHNTRCSVKLTPFNMIWRDREERQSFVVSTANNNKMTAWCYIFRTNARPTLIYVEAIV